MLLRRAPQLFAALLRKAGASSQLLPLLAEPASAAVRGLSITARRAHPKASAAFLKVRIRSSALHVILSSTPRRMSLSPLGAHFLEGCVHHVPIRSSGAPKFYFFVGDQFGFEGPHYYEHHAVNLSSSLYVLISTHLVLL